MPLPPRTPLPEPPEPARKPTWRDRLHAETPEQKHRRLELKYPKGHWMHRKFPCIERQGMSFVEAARKRQEATPRPTDGQGFGLPEHPDIPF